MPFGSVYKIVFPNGKHYIGQTTTSLEQRQNGHKSHANNGDTLCLYNALRKYKMVDTFELIEIDTADTKDELCKKEIDYIQKYNSFYNNGRGYNMTLGGEGTAGYVHTEYEKQQQSERQTKFYEENPEEREKMKIISQTFWNKPESKEKMSKIRLISHNTPEAKQHMSEGVKKYYAENPEAGKEHGERLKKYFEENPEARQKMSERGKQYYEENPEARQKMSERGKQYYEENPEAGKEHSEKMKKYYQENPEAREQMSETKKKYFEENPEAGKAHGERMKKYYEDNLEARQKCSGIGKELWKRPEHKTNILDKRGKNKIFDVFTDDGTFIKTFTYQYEARDYLQKEHHITSTIKIGSVLNGDRKSSAGFVFRYK